MLKGAIRIFNISLLIYINLFIFPNTGSDLKVFSLPMLRAHPFINHLPLWVSILFYFLMLGSCLAYFIHPVKKIINSTKRGGV